MKKIFKMADLIIFQQGSADVLLLRSELDISCSRQHTVVFS